MPGPAEVPPRRVPWLLQPSRAALLIHDMQNYFVSAFPAGQAPVTQLVAHIDLIRRACAASDVPVFYSAQPGKQAPADRGLQSDFWGPGMTSAAEHQAIVDALAPRPGDTVLTKWRYSAFQRTDFEAALRARGRDQLVVTGVYASIGCALTAADAFMRDVQPFIVCDAVADFTRQRHDEALRFVAERFAVPLTTEQTLADLQGISSGSL
jgi:bifunctional isochorismate lyase/aryl carrier protein